MEVITLLYVIVGLAGFNLLIYFFPWILKKHKEVQEDSPPHGANWYIRFMGDVQSGETLPYYGKITKIRRNLRSGTIVIEFRLKRFGPFKEIMVKPENLIVPDPASLLAGEGEIWCNVGLDNKVYPWSGQVNKELREKVIEKRVRDAMIRDLGFAKEIFDIAQGSRRGYIEPPGEGL